MPAMEGGLPYAWYGDDFTGAADTLATVASAGLRACLFLGVPTPAQLERAGPLDALGIAGTARGLAPAAMHAELAPLADFIAGCAPAITHYKCCSTFDSAPAVGNLRIGLESLQRRTTGRPWLVLGGQPSLGRYCAFGHLFAAAGQGGEVLRLDRHPTMSRHPVTPMDESDLRQHLARQALAPVALIDWRALETLDLDALAALADAQAKDAAALLFDALRPEHLAMIGRLWWRRARRQPQLVLGASSVAQALIAAWPEPGRRAPVMRAADAPASTPAAGPAFVLVGSLSPVTAHQVSAAQGRYTRIELPAGRLMASESALARAAEACARALREDGPVLAQLSPPDPGHPIPPLALAQAGGRLLARVLAAVPGLRRVGIAGGDTASWALRELAPWALQWASTVAPGVPLLRARADDPRLDGLQLMLKGGQMGPPDLFERLLAA